MSFRINGSSSPIPTGQCREGPGGILHMQWIWITAGVPWTEGTQISYQANLPDLCPKRHYIYYFRQKTNLPSASQRDTECSISQGYSLKKKKILVKTVQSKEASASAQKMYRNTKETWRTVSQLLHIYYGWMYLPLWLSIESVSVAQAVSFNSVSFTFYSMW